MAIDFKTLEKLVALAKKHKLAELEVEDGKSKVRFRTARDVPGSVVSTSVLGSTNQKTEVIETSSLPLAESSKSRISSGDDRYQKVASPFVGTFYRSPSPEADPYVQDGQMVKKGDVLCIIEAMKLMNEIEAESSGRVVSVLAENGQPVEYGEALFLIDPV